MTEHDKKYLTELEDTIYKFENDLDYDHDDVLNIVEDVAGDESQYHNDLDNAFCNAAIALEELRDELRAFRAHWQNDAES